MNASKTNQVPTYRSTQASALSKLSLNTLEILLIISKLSVASLSTLVLASIAADCERPPEPLAARSCGSSALAALLHRSGSIRIKVRTLAFACSGNAEPAYLETTSTTCRIVLTSSRLTRAKISSDSNGTSAVEVEVEEEELEADESGVIEVMKERSITIC